MFRKIAEPPQTPDLKQVKEGIPDDEAGVVTTYVENEQGVTVTRIKNSNCILGKMPKTPEPPTMKI